MATNQERHNGFLYGYGTTPAHEAAYAPFVTMLGLQQDPHAILSVKAEMSDANWAFQPEAAAHYGTGTSTLYAYDPTLDFGQTIHVGKTTGAYSKFVRQQGSIYHVPITHHFISTITNHILSERIPCMNHGIFVPWPIDGVPTCLAISGKSMRRTGHRDCIHSYDLATGEVNLVDDGWALDTYWGAAFAYGFRDNPPWHGYMPDLSHHLGSRNTKRGTGPWGSYLGHVGPWYMENIAGGTNDHCWGARTNSQNTQWRWRPLPRFDASRSLPNWYIFHMCGRGQAELIKNLGRYKSPMELEQDIMEVYLAKGEEWLQTSKAIFTAATTRPKQVLAYQTIIASPKLILPRFIQAFKTWAATRYMPVVPPTIPPVTTVVPPHDPQLPAWPKITNHRSLLAEFPDYYARPPRFGYPTTPEHELAYAEVAELIGAKLDPCDPSNWPTIPAGVTGPTAAVQCNHFSYTYTDKFRNRCSYIAHRLTQTVKQLNCGVCKIRPAVPQPGTMSAYTLGGCPTMLGGDTATIDAAKLGDNMIDGDAVYACDGCVLFGYGYPCNATYDLGLPRGEPMVLATANYAPLPNSYPSARQGLRNGKPWVVALPLTDWKPAFGWYLEGCTPTMFVEAQAMATHLDAASLTTPAACWGKETGDARWRWRPLPRQYATHGDLRQLTPAQKLTTPLELEKEVFITIYSFFLQILYAFLQSSRLKNGTNFIF